MENNELYTSDIISEILTKYGLKESDGQLAEKYFGNHPAATNGQTIFFIAKQISEGKTPEKDLSDFLQKSFNITKEVSESMGADIIKNLLPVMKLEPKKEIEPSEQINKTENTPIKTVGEKNIVRQNLVKPPEKRGRPAKNIVKPPEVKKIIRSGPDNYREPIE